jgi:hypothetical protein
MKSRFSACLLGACLMVAAPAAEATIVETFSVTPSSIETNGPAVVSLALSIVDPGFQSNWFGGGAVDFDNGDGTRIQFVFAGGGPLAVFDYTHTFGAPRIYTISYIFTDLYWGTSNGVYYLPPTAEGSGSADLLVSDPVIAAVPEPSTWAMMILGFAGIGFMGYRRSRKDQSLALASA